MLDRFFKMIGYERRGQLAVSSPELLALFQALPNAAGVSVTSENALRSPTCLAAVRVDQLSVIGSIVST